MKEQEIERLISWSRERRLEDLAVRLLQVVDRSPSSLLRFGWELEEEFNESLWVSLDLLGWNPPLLREELLGLRAELEYLRGWFEREEEYECCAVLQEADRWLSDRVEFFLQQIEAGSSPESLIGL